MPPGRSSAPLASFYGIWHHAKASTFTNWTKKSDFSYDQAFITVRTNNGRKLVDASVATASFSMLHEYKGRFRFEDGPRSCPTPASTQFSAVATPVLGAPSHEI